MLDCLLSRSFLDASGVRRAGTVRADAGIPILPVFISDLQVVREEQDACASRKGLATKKSAALEALMALDRTRPGVLCGSTDDIAKFAAAPCQTRVASHSVPLRSPHIPSMSAESGIRRALVEGSLTEHAGLEKSIADRGRRAAQPGPHDAPV